MKKVLLLLMVLVLPMVAGAQKDISAEQALTIAEHFFAGQPASAKARKGAKASAMKVAYTSLRKGGEAALYVVNRGDDSGFVLVSADSDTDHPVLGWSDNGSFDYDTAPIQLKDMLEAYSQSKVHRESDAESSIDGLVELSDGRMAFQVNDGQRQRMIGISLKSAKHASQSACRASFAESGQLGCTLPLMSSWASRSSETCLMVPGTMPSLPM